MHLIQNVDNEGEYLSSIEENHLEMAEKSRLSREKRTAYMRKYRLNKRQQHSSSEEQNPEIAVEKNRLSRVDKRTAYMRKYRANKKQQKLSDAEYGANEKQQKPSDAEMAASKRAKRKIYLRDYRVKRKI